MKTQKQIWQNKQMTLFLSYILSLVLCLNLSFSLEEEYKENEKEIEIELIFSTSKKENFETVEYYYPNLFFNQAFIKLNDYCKEFKKPFINYKLYIYYCQLALKSFTII